MISKETILGVISGCLSEQGVKIPDNLEGDFSRYLPDLPNLESFNQIRTQLCRTIGGLIKNDEEFGEKYGEIYGQIAHLVRIKLVCLLGFDDYVNRPTSDDSKSSREILKEFLKSLKDGEEWNVKKLSIWEVDGDNVGSRLKTRIGAVVGRWNLDVVRIILGDDANALLERNPFERLEWRIETIYDARRYLREYLTGLPEGVPWSYTTLCEWKSSDGAEGITLAQQIPKKAKCSGLTEDAVRNALGKEADALLARNPFTKRILRLTSKPAAKAALLDFMSGLSEGEIWSIHPKLDTWLSADGIGGSDLYKWVLRNFGDFNESTIKELLGEDADKALRRNPFTKNEVKNKDAESVRGYLMAFFDEMGGGKAWCVSDLQKYGQIGADGPKGAAVESWIRRNSDGNFNLANLVAVLGEVAESVLRRNPFEVRHVNRVVNAEVAAKYLTQFIGSWPQDTSWSPNDLQQYGEIGDGIYGYSVYDWICRNCTDGFEESSLRVLLGDVADNILARAPFERRLVYKILSLEDFRKFFLVFLDSLRGEKYWSPNTLIQFKTRNDNMPNGRAIYSWIRRNITHDGTIDWLYILIELIPHEYLKKHPFRHRYLGEVSVKSLAGCPKRQAVTPREEVKWPTVEYALHSSAPDPEKLLLAKEQVELMMLRRQFIDEIYKYMEIDEWILMNRFYNGEDIGDDKLLYLMGRVREIFMEHRPYLFNDDFR